MSAHSGGKLLCPRPPLDEFPLESSPLLGALIYERYNDRVGSEIIGSEGKSPAEAETEIEAGVGAEAESTQSEIGRFGSFILLVNNITGPAFMGFPYLFQNAGWLPVVLAIIFVHFCASFCGVFLSHAISTIEGNDYFQRNIDFSTAFHILAGDTWYVIAEALFLLTCSVQAVAGIVEASQSLDSFIASFLLGKTYAVQFYPRVEVVYWSPDSCNLDVEVAPGYLEDVSCVPFHTSGPLVMTMGFVVITMIVLPMGTGDLKDTMPLQILSFLFLMVLVVHFAFGFVQTGLPHQVAAWKSDWSSLSQLAGVVLFNYSYSVTVPSWLAEKRRDVSVSQIIWSATTLSSCIYIVFGLLGAMAYSRVGENILVVLTSVQVGLTTRLGAALFGVLIIGSGIPVFCVIINKALVSGPLHGRPRMSLFLGAVLPFCFSWMLYQGEVLMAVLNWSGLIVSGLVAFIGPMVLALKAWETRARAVGKKYEAEGKGERTVWTVVGDESQGEKKMALQVEPFSPLSPPYSSPLALRRSQLSPPRINKASFALPVDASLQPQPLHPPACSIPSLTRITSDYSSGSSGSSGSGYGSSANSDDSLLYTDSRDSISSAWESVFRAPQSTQHPYPHPQPHPQPHPHPQPQPQVVVQQQQSPWGWRHLLSPLTPHTPNTPAVPSTGSTIDSTSVYRNTSSSKYPSSSKRTLADYYMEPAIVAEGGHIRRSVVDFDHSNSRNVSPRKDPHTGTPIHAVLFPTTSSSTTSLEGTFERMCIHSWRPYCGSICLSDSEKFHTSPLPRWLRPYQRHIIYFILGCFVVIISLTIVMDTFQPS